jgi:ABC-type xylose transport system permease subunit
VIQIIIAALIYWVITWGIAQIGIPEPFSKIVKVVLVLAVVVFLVNALLSLGGHPMVSWSH